MKLFFLKKNLYGLKSLGVSGLFKMIETLNSFTNPPFLEGIIIESLL